MQKKKISLSGDPYSVPSPSLACFQYASFPMPTGSFVNISDNPQFQYESIDLDIVTCHVMMFWLMIGYVNDSAILYSLGV